MFIIVNDNIIATGKTEIRMTRQSTAAESRSFKMHPELLFSVIRSQAGTLSKALLELAMNGIDAGGTKVDIRIDRTSFSVTDDGKGFRDKTEITEFFETFGTPHKEGDATYGKFRMGRGQSFAFARNVWRSGGFRMDVDIQRKGLDYGLETGLPTHKGCRIEGKLYERLDPSELIQTERTISEMCRYTPVPVTVNGKTITVDPKGQKWTTENDDAYIKATDGRQLSVYNLGVLVAHFSASEFGVGGVVVSKRQLDLNFARNDILRNKCQTWKRLRPILAKLSGEINGKEPAQRRTEEWRAFQARRVMSAAEVDHKEQREIEDLPIFTDITGKHLSMAQLSRLARKMAVTVADGRSLVADRLHQSKIACVLAKDCLTDRFGADIREVLERVGSIRSTNPRWGNDSPMRHIAEAIGKAITPYQELAKTMNSEHHPMDAQEVPKDAKAALMALDDAMDSIRTTFRSTGINPSPRMIKAMKSETADAYTDGRANVFINMRLLRGRDGPNQGIAWAARMASLLVHEHCHDFDSGTGHTHDAEFHELFHAAASSDGFGWLVARIAQAWARRSKDELGKVGLRVMAQIDGDTRSQDRLEAAQA